MRAAEREVLEGRTALITGAGNGLGRQIALQLARAGCRTVLAGRRRETLDASARLVGDAGAAARVVQMDVSEDDSVARAMEELADEDISVLVNNAGIAGPVVSMTDLSVEDWDEVFATNVRGTFLMCRAVAPQMLRRGAGDIVNVASVTGKRPLERRTPYAASKLAVIGFTRTLASELGPKGVRVNTLSPGPVRGPRMDRNFQHEAERSGVTPEEVEARLVARIADGRLIEEAEVGRAVVAMLTMSGLSGADIDLSAGMIAPA